MKGQAHGKQFEDMLKACRFPGSADHGRSSTAGVDVESKFDRDLGLDTSIKTTRNCGVVTLADARAVWVISTPFRLMVGCWRQVTPTAKEFYEVREFIVHGGMMDWLRGSVSLADVTALHVGLGLAAFPHGHHIEARAWAKREQARLKTIGTRLTLNPKIDSKGQRRLQCSVPMATLMEMASLLPCIRDDVPNLVTHVTHVGGLPLPFPLRSPPRSFS